MPKRRCRHRLTDVAKRKAYPWDVKAEVLAVYETDGPAATADLFGVSKHTIKSWAMRSGMQTDAGAINEAIGACVLNERCQMQ